MSKPNAWPGRASLCPDMSCSSPWWMCMCECACGLITSFIMHFFPAFPVFTAHATRHINVAINFALQRHRIPVCVRCPAMCCCVCVCESNAVHVCSAFLVTTPPTMSSLRSREVGTSAQITRNLFAVYVCCEKQLPPTPPPFCWGAANAILQGQQHGVERNANANCKLHTACHLPPAQNPVDPLSSPELYFILFRCLGGL